MPEIAPVKNSTVGPLNAIQAPGRDSGERSISQEQPLQQHRGRDRVEVSHHANWLQMLRELPEIRQDRVDAVRQAIEGDTYITQDKIDRAVEGLLRDTLD